MGWSILNHPLNWTVYNIQMIHVCLGMHLYVSTFEQNFKHFGTLPTKAVTLTFKI